MERQALLPCCTELHLNPHGSTLELHTYVRWEHLVLDSNFVCHSCIHAHTHAHTAHTHTAHTHTHTHTPVVTASWYAVPSDISIPIYCTHLPPTLVCAQRYYYYINNGIDTSHVAPLEDSWLLHVLNRVPVKHKVRVLWHRDIWGMECCAVCQWQLTSLSLPSLPPSSSSLPTPPLLPLCLSCCRDPFQSKWTNCQKR